MDAYFNCRGVPSRSDSVSSNSCAAARSVASPKPRVGLLMNRRTRFGAWSLLCVLFRVSDCNLTAALWRLSGHCFAFHAAATVRDFQTCLKAYVEQ